VSTEGTQRPDPEATTPSYRGDPQPAERIGRYRLLAPLGRGGMGVVYRAHHDGLDQEYAVKLLRAGTDAPQEIVERFLREARAVARIGKHPNIVQVHDVGEQDGCYYLAMDLVDGAPLSSHTAKGPLPPREAAGIACGIARGLQVAHDAGIIHRDLKPSNVLVDRAGVPHVADFGLARDILSRQRLSREGDVFGTPQYMAPEQAAGENDRVGPATDVYGLGATLYEMLTGRPPFDAGTSAELLYRVLSQEPAPPSDVPADLATICLKALEKDPSRRYPSARAMEEDLARFLAGEPVRARRASPLARLLRRAARHWRAAAAVGVVAILAGVLLVRAHIRSLEEGRRVEDREAATRLAEAQAAAARAALAKSQLVSKVYARWGALRDTMREIEATASDVRLHEKGERLKAAWTRVQEFIDATPPDATSQATMKALAGWAKCLSGDDGRAWMREAAALDPDVPYGALLEALVEFSGYLDRQETPTAMLTSRGVDLPPMPAETPEMAEVRRRIDALLVRARAAPVWGEDLAADFQAAIDGMRSMQAGRYEEADLALGRALGSRELSLFETGLRLARAKARYARRDYDAAIQDTAEVCRALPGDVAPHQYLGLLQLSRAVAARAAGTDARPLAQEAVATLDTAIALDPREASCLRLRGSAKALLAGMEEGAGGSPREGYLAALLDLEAAHSIQPEDVGGLQNLGIAQGHVGLSEVNSGGDGREAYRKSIARFSEALRIDAEYDPARTNRAIIYRMLGDAELEHGGDPRQLYERGIADMTATIARNPPDKDRMVVRAILHLHMGQAQGVRGEDPREELRRAVADYDEAVRLGDGDGLTYYQRAVAHRGLANAEGTMPHMQAAIEDFDRALVIGPNDGEAHFGRGTVCWMIADARLRAGEDPKPRYRDAIDSFGKAIEYGYNLPVAYCNRSAAWLGLAQAQVRLGIDPQAAYRESVSDAEAALAADPHNWDAVSNGWGALRGLGEDARALELCESAEKAGCKEPWLLEAIPELRKRLGR